MNCAASLGGRVNLNRFGEYLFGNEAVVEKHTMLSGRDEQAAADGEEGDGEEGDGEEWPPQRATIIAPNRKTQFFEGFFYRKTQLF